MSGSVDDFGELRAARLRFLRAAVGAWGEWSALVGALDVDAVSGQRVAEASGLPLGWTTMGAVWRGASANSDHLAII